MKLERLIVPFRKDELEHRLAACGESNSGIWGQCLTYITSRAIMDRLDEVCGPENWTATYEFVGQKGVVCNLSIKIGAEWITKQDGAEMTDIEAFKGGLSSALKRAGNAWGVGRYLYSLESGYVTVVDKNTVGAQYGKLKSGTVFYWVPPPTPEWALPKGTPTVEREQVKPVVHSSPSVAQHEQAAKAAFGQLGPSNGNGSYTVPFGKFKGKTLHEVPMNDLLSYVTFLKNNTSGKPQSQNASTFIHEVESLSQAENNFGEIPF